jgi:hypothetical protein
VQVLSDYDLDSGNFKDKESKIAYLNKVIGAVSDAVGAVAVKPLKIVAGLEPENTNALLQALARAAAGGAPAPEPPKEERRKRAEATLPPQPAEVERPQRAEGRLQLAHRSRSVRRSNRCDLPPCPDQIISITLCISSRHSFFCMYRGGQGQLTDTAGLAGTRTDAWIAQGLRCELPRNRQRAQQ